MERGIAGRVETLEDMRILVKENDKMDEYLDSTVASRSEAEGMARHLLWRCPEVILSLHARADMSVPPSFSSSVTSESELSDMAFLPSSGLMMIALASLRWYEGLILGLYILSDP